jgi:hypothetical protein
MITLAIRSSAVMKNLALIVASIGLIAGCTSAHRPTQSQRSAIEQLLISEAMMRSLSGNANGSLPIPKGAKVMLDVTAISVATGFSSDQFLLEKILGSWLGKQGYAIQKKEEQASYRINIIAAALGTELGDSFFGMPPVTSQLIPFSLPELAIYKNQYQTGFVKFYMDIFDVQAGTLVHSSPFHIAETYYNDYTFLIFFTFSSTDLPAAPKLELIRKPPEHMEKGMRKSLPW